MKKIISILLLAVLCLSLVACGESTYDKYMNAEFETAVTVDMYVQATQSWWDNKITVYGADENGAYFVYEMACTEEDAARLVPGTRIKVTGVKGVWNGEVEIVDATFEFIGTNTYIAPAKDITTVLGTDAIADYMNARVSATALTVVAQDENNVIYYSWDNSGSHGSDIYFKLTDGTNNYVFVVETYFTSADSEVYAAVEALEVGDVVNVEAFLYWYEGMQPHVVSVTVVEEPAEA